MKLDSGSIILRRSYIPEVMINEHLVVGALAAINSLFKEGKLGEIDSIDTKKYRNKFYFDEDKNLMIISILPLTVSYSQKLDDLLIQVLNKMLEIHGKNDFYNFSGNVSLFENNSLHIDEMVNNYHADWVLEQYPENFIFRVQKVQDDLTKGIVRQIGEISGRKLVQPHEIITYKDRLDKLKMEIEKIGGLTVKDDREFIFKPCKFCNGTKKDKKSKPHCKFLEGFLEGFLNIRKIIETRCHRMGDTSCNFIIC